MKKKNKDNLIPASIEQVTLAIIYQDLKRSEMAYPEHSRRIRQQLKIIHDIQISLLKKRDKKSDFPVGYNKLAILFELGYRWGFGKGKAKALKCR